MKPNQFVLVGVTSLVASVRSLSSGTVGVLANASSRAANPSVTSTKATVAQNRAMTLSSSHHERIREISRSVAGRSPVRS